MVTPRQIMLEENVIRAGIESAIRIQRLAEECTDPVNKDCWGTLAVNLETLAIRCRLAADTIRGKQ